MTTHYLPFEMFEIHMFGEYVGVKWELDNYEYKVSHTEGTVTTTTIVSEVKRCRKIPWLGFYDVAPYGDDNSKEELRGKYYLYEDGPDITYLISESNADQLAEELISAAKYLREQKYENPFNFQ